MARLRHKKNMIQGGLLALVKYFAANDFAQEFTYEGILLKAFDWDDDERAEKLNNYLTRIDRIDDVYGILPMSRRDLAEDMELNEDLVDECVDLLKASDNITQYGGGYGRMLIMSGQKIEIEDLDDFVIHLHQNARNEEVQQAGNQQGVAPGLINWAELEAVEDPKKQVQLLAQSFRAMADKFENMEFSDPEQQREQAELIDNLITQRDELQQELNLVKRTSWQ